MRQFIRGERAKLSDLAAINHLWEIEASLEAPYFVVDFCCLGLGASGEVVDDRYLVSYNQPDAPRDAIRLDNVTNTGAVFKLNMQNMPVSVRRLVFTATLQEPEMPGGLLGAAFSLFGVNTASIRNAELGHGQLRLRTPAKEVGYADFSGQDFGEESTLILGEFYWRDEWRFVAAGQPLKGELSDFLRTLTDGPAPFSVAISTQTPTAPRLTVPPRLPSNMSGSSLKDPSSVPIRVALGAPISKPVHFPLAPLPAPFEPVVQSLMAQSATVPHETSLRDTPPPTSPTPISPSLFRTPVSPVLPQELSAGSKLQDLIDAAKPGSTLTLLRDEYEGPVRISNALVIEGRGSALWARSGPVVVIAAHGVELHNLDIEVTVSLDTLDETGVALKLDTQFPQLHLDNVRVRGRISGMGAEDGIWNLPKVLQLGQFAPRTTNDFRFSIEVPTRVHLSSQVEGVFLSPAEVDAGWHQISLEVRDIPAETLVVGFVEVRSASLVRTVPLSGSTTIGVAPRRGQEI